MAPITNDIVLPSEQELTVPEVKLSAVVLRAAAFHLGKYCENFNNEYMLCRSEYPYDPRFCLNEGKSVTNCTLKFFRLVKSQCAEEFKKYYTCIDRRSSDYKFTPCRRTQEAFDTCMLENFDIIRPEYGYFCRVKVHTTDRPKPEEPPQKFDASDLPQSLPDDYPRNRYYRPPGFWLGE